MPSSGALLLLAFAGTVILLLLLLLHLTRLGLLLRVTTPDRPRRRMFVASISFLITFVGVRVLVSLITHNVGPFHWVMMGGQHIHHLVWGILILLMVGYGWLLDVGRSHSATSIFFSHLMSISYGVGAALTLDEFALWLSLDPNAYWSREGRLSVDAVIVFGSLLSIGAWGAQFFSGLHKMWKNRTLFVKKLDEDVALSIHRARLLRPRK